VLPVNKKCQKDNNIVAAPSPGRGPASFPHGMCGWSGRAMGIWRFRPMAGSGDSCRGPPARACQGPPALDSKAGTTYRAHLVSRCSYLAGGRHSRSEKITPHGVTTNKAGWIDGEVQKLESGWHREISMVSPELHLSQNPQTQKRAGGLGVPPARFRSDVPHLRGSGILPVIFHTWASRPRYGRTTRL
jgi:hypothetical protein